MVAKILDLDAERQARQLAKLSGCDLALARKAIAAAASKGVRFAPEREAGPAFFEPSTPYWEQFVPAYCDPANERRGHKYDPSVRRSTKEIAALVRADIKAALAAGELPKGLKVSVRYESFSGGSAIRVNVTALPEGFEVFDLDTLRAQRAQPYDWQTARLPRYTAEAQALLAALTRIGKAYHRNNSDAMTDYFDVNYYGGDADFAFDLEQAARKAAEEKL